MSSCQRNGFVLFLGSYQVPEIPSIFDFNQIISFVIYLSLRVLLSLSTHKVKRGFSSAILFITFVLRNAFVYTTSL